MRKNPTPFKKDAAYGVKHGIGPFKYHPPQKKKPAPATNKQNDE